MGANEWNKCRVLIKIRTFLFPSSIIAPCMLNTHTHTSIFPAHTRTHTRTYPGLSHTLSLTYVTLSATHTHTLKHTHKYTRGRVGSKASSVLPRCSHTPPRNPLVGQVFLSLVTDTSVSVVVSVQG